MGTGVKGEVYSSHPLYKAPSTLKMPHWLTSLQVAEVVVVVDNIPKLVT